MLWGEALLPGLLQLAQAFHSLVILVALGHAAEAYHLWFSSAGRRTPSLVPAHCQAAVVVRVPKETFACPALRLRKARWRNRSIKKIEPFVYNDDMCNYYDSLGPFWGMLLKRFSLGELLILVFVHCYLVIFAAIVCARMLLVSQELPLRDSHDD